MLDMMFFILGMSFLAFSLTRTFVVWSTKKTDEEKRAAAVEGMVSIILGMLLLVAMGRVGVS